MKNKNNLSKNKNVSGQILILGGLLALVVMVFGYMLLNIGKVTEERIKLQNTADAAAFAAAESQANTVSSMGWLNQAMGTVYYYMASHAANVTVESTKMAFVHQGYNGSKTETYDKQKTDLGAGINADNSILVDGLTIGTEDEITAAYDKAYLDAYTMIPRGEIWLWQMAKVQRGMAYIAPLMAEKEVYLAIKDKAARASLFPKYKMYVDPADNFDLEIHKIYETNVKTGWDMAGNPGGLTLFAERDETDFGPYDMNSSDDPLIWKVYLRYKLQATAPENELFIESLGKLPPKNEVSMYRIKGSFPGWTTWRYIMYNPDGTTIITGSGDTVKITQNADGSTTIQGGSTNITYRRNGNTFEVKNASGGWDSMGEVAATIDGVDVRVTTNFSISLGDITIVDPNHYVIGNTDIHVNKDDIDISTQIGRANVRTDKGTVIVNGLATVNADGKWHRIWEDSWTDTLKDQGGDTIRHRMLVVHPNTDWKYELREIGSYTQEENDEAHQGDGRFSISNGANFVLGKQGLTKNDVDWLGYPTEQAKDIADDKFSSKWYDLSKINGGKPSEYKENINGVDKVIEAFHLVEECWNPECKANGSKGFYPVEYTCYEVSKPNTPYITGGVEVKFTELEMCRICYDNHRKVNHDKRKVPFLSFPIPPAPPIAPGTFDFPDCGSLVNDGRIVIWTDYNSAFGGLGQYNDVISNKYFWKRKSPLTPMAVDVPVADLNKRPASIVSSVKLKLDYFPKFMVDGLGGKAASAITYDYIKDTLVNNVTLPWDMDHDGNNTADVIMYPSDARELNRNVASWFYYEVMDDTMPSDEYLKSMQILGLSCPKPMVLSEEFFKYGINVAVTSDKYTEVPAKRFLGLENQDKGGGNTPILTSIGPTKWGMVALSSARSAFWLDSNGTGSYIFSPGDIDWSQDNAYAQSYQTFKNNTGLGLDGSTNFAYDNSVNFEDQDEYRMRRQFFVRRHNENLYTSDWVAKLVPMKYAIRKDDLGLSDTDDFDSSARYIYYNLMHTEWRETYIKTSGWKPPESMTLGPKGPSLSTKDTDIEAIFTH